MSQERMKRTIDIYVSDRVDLPHDDSGFWNHRVRMTQLPGGAVIDEYTDKHRWVQIRVSTTMRKGEEVEVLDEALAAINQTVAQITGKLCSKCGPGISCRSPGCPGAKWAWKPLYSAPSVGGRQPVVAP